MTHRWLWPRRISQAVIGVLLVAQQYAMADAGAMAASLQRVVAVADELKLVHEVSRGLDTFVGEFVSAIDGAADQNVEEYEYEGAVQVLRDVLLSRENPFMLLAGHYERQVKALSEQRGELRFDANAYAVSQDRLDNCVNHFDELTLLEDHLVALRELVAALASAVSRLDLAIEPMFVRSSGEGPDRLEAESAHRVLDAWVEGYRTLIEFPDPFRVVQTDALRYYLTINSDTRPALSRLEDAVTALHRDLALLVAEVDGEVTRLESTRASQPPCRFFIGTWRGTCSFAGHATVNAEIALRRHNEAQAGTFTILSGTEFEVSQHGEVTVYTVESASFEVQGFRVLPIGVAVGVQFGLVGGGQAQSATFTGFFDNTLTRLSGHAGDEVDPTYVRCDLEVSTP